MSCDDIFQLGYGEFSRRIHEKALQNRIPIQGSIDITSRCNLRCAQCYIEGTCYEPELSYTQICGIIDQVAEEGCLWMLVTGGEPLLRKDFMDIYGYIRSKGIIVALFTNAVLMTPRIADFLAELPPFVVEISLYGMSEETYERVTGIPGSFQRCLRGINLLVERKIPVQLKTVALTLNYHEIPEMKKYAESLGLPFRFDTMINAKLDGSMEPAKLRLSPREVLALDMQDEKRQAGWEDMCERLWKAPKTDRLYTCGAGVNSFHITSTGELAECVLSRRVHYNLLEGTFREGFYEAIPAVITARRTRYSECQDCPMIGVCGSCVAWGELEHGDPESKSDYLCQVAHLRAAAFKEGYQEKVVAEK